MSHHPLLVLRDVCETKQVHPTELLLHLLEHLQKSHMMNSIQSFIFGATNQSTVTQEVQGMMGAIGKPNQMPVSMLASLDVLVTMQQWMDTENVKVYRNAGHEGEAQLMEKSARCGEALHLIIQQLTNSAEHDGMRNAQIIEERAEKGEGSPQRPPVDENPDTPGKDQP
jgi:hypothetical protein